MQSATQLHPIWRDYPALQPELQQVMQLMTANIIDLQLSVPVSDPAVA